MDSLVYGLIIGSVFCFILYLIGLNRKASKAIASKPNDVITFTTQKSKIDVFRAIIMFAQMSDLNVESFDEAQGQIVLGQDLNMLKNHNGYWLPVYISESGGGSTIVEIGIKSKTYQVGFMLRSIRDKAANNIKAAIMTQGGSIV